MATTSSGTFTVTRNFVQVDSTGAATITLNYVGASGQIFTRTLRVDAAGAQVVDQLGNVVATPAPVALMNAISTFASQIDSLIANAATAGKLAL